MLLSPRNRTSRVSACFGLPGGRIPAPDELERQLREHAQVATEEVKQIGQQRAQAARDYLRDTRSISNERLYLLAPRIAEAGDARPPHRADFAVK